MSDLTHGMDLAAVEELGRFLQAQADAFDLIVWQVDALVRSTSWVGADADRFRHDWWPSHRGQVLDAAERVRGLGQSALNNASEQADVSGVTSREGASAPGRGSGAGGANGDTFNSVDWSLAPAALAAVLGFAPSIADVAEIFGTDTHLINRLASRPGAAQARRILGWAGWGAGVANSGWQLAEAVESGDGIEITKKVVGGVVAVGSAHPYVAIGATIWDVDYFLAEQAVGAADRAGLLGGTDDFQSHMYRELYGTERPSVSQLEDFGQRYDGLAGQGRYAADVFGHNAQRGYDAVEDAAGSVLDFFGRR